MGKLTLMFVLAAVLGGAILTFSTRQLVGEAEGDRRGAQAEVLARDLAQSVHNVVAGAMMGSTGFQQLRDLGIRTVSVSTGDVGSVEYAGGTADVAYAPSTDRQRVDFSVTAFQEGAVHRVNASYAFDDVDFPTPLWLDVPYVTTSLAPGTTVSGGTGSRQPVFDRSKYDELGLAGIAPPLTQMAGAVSSVLGALPGTANSLSVRNRTELSQLPGMEDVNVANAEGLYFAAVDAMGSGDTNLGSTNTLSGTVRYGTAASPRIVRAPNGLTISSTGRVSGTGALVVEGPLTVALGGSLDWDGLVIIHTDQDYLPIRLMGAVVIDGSLIVDQQGAPPGGHMDVSTWRSNSGAWPTPAGDLAGSPFCAPYPGTRCPWWQHTHRYDITPVGAERGRDVRFLGRDASESQLASSLAALGSREVYLEFANHEAYSGMGRFTMDVDGDDAAGVVRLGFDQSDGSLGDRSQPFQANDLRQFDLQVRSLRMLRPLWDGSGSCGVSWPVCVGESSNRQQALTVRVRDAATDRSHYEAAVYWHMQEGEVAEHEAEEQAWRDRIEAGEAFGTRLETGAAVQLRFDPAMIRLIGPRLGFDAPEHDLIATTTQHWEVGEAGGPELSHVPAAGSYLVCHNGEMKLLPVAAMVAHDRHGDYLGACAVPAPSPTTNPNTIVSVCCRGTTHTGTLAQVQSHLNNHGAVMGQCSGSGDDDDDD